MSMEMITNIQLKRVMGFEELCKECGVNENGIAEKGNKIFVWDTSMEALVRIDKIYYEEERLAKLGKTIYNAEDVAIFVEDFGA